MRWLLGLFLLMMFSHQTVFAALSSWVQGDVFVQGEAFELIVEAEEDGDLQIPEMDGLKILSRSTQSQTSIINGSISKAHRWIFTILPNQAGVLRIPPFQLGNEQTEEIQLEIADRKSHQMALPIEIAARVEPRQVYPQQQLVLEIRLERGIPVENESLTPPDLPNVPVKLLDQQNEQQVRNGRRLNVTTLRYAIFPQESGNLEIPALTYQGDAILASKGQSLFQGLNRHLGAKTQRVVLQTPSQQVRVIPVPRDAQGWWLPAQEMVLQEQWDPNPPVFRVGDSVSRQIRLRATGLLGEQLPEWNMSMPESLKIYSDPAEVKTSNDNHWVTGERFQSFALVPTKPGKIKLPAIEINWWNLQTNQPQVARLPERTIEILPAALAPTQLQPLDTTVTTTTAEGLATQEMNTDSWLWQSISAALLALWAGTIGLWFWTAKTQSAKPNNAPKASQEESPKVRQAYKDALDALRSGNALRSRSALMSWLRSWHPSPKPSWTDLCSEFPDAQTILKDLDRYCYGKDSRHWDPSGLLNWLCELPANPTKKEPLSTPESERLWWRKSA
ncbi:MAG: BatD family protein [bacterium]